jgi:ATP-dependent helicase Lhr and Lhr-like helicase
MWALKVIRSAMAAIRRGSGWQAQWGPLPLFGDDDQQIMDYLLDAGFLDHDQGTAFIGAEAEKHFGRRHFMELLAVFTAAPQFIVYAGRAEIGSVEASVLTAEVEGERVLLLAGRSWRVTHVDWTRRQVFVEATDQGGTARWMSLPDGASHAITRGARSVLLGADPAGVRLTRRAVDALANIRAARSAQVSAGRLIVARDERGNWRWWTWAGAAANRTLAAWADQIVVPRQRIGPESLRLQRHLGVADIQEGFAAALARPHPRPLPVVDPAAVRGLKFSVALPADLAVATIAARSGDPVAAETVLGEQLSVVASG